MLHQCLNYMYDATFLETQQNTGMHQLECVPDIQQPQFVSCWGRSQKVFEHSNGLLLILCELKQNKVFVELEQGVGCGGGALVAGTKVDGGWGDGQDI